MPRGMRPMVASKRGGADFSGADLTSAKLIAPVGLDAALHLDKALNIDRALRR